MIKLSQEKIILARMEKRGYADNFWCIKNNILRLGTRINSLKKAGFKFVSGSGRDFKKPRNVWKNYYYYLLK